MNIPKKFMLLLLFFSTTAVALQAQEATAAALYNEGLASLKAKDFQAGYDKTKAALDAAKAEENEQVTDLAQKNLAKATYYLGMQKLKEKEVDAALALFDEGIAANPDYASSYLGKGQALQTKGKSVEAVELYFKSAKLSEDAGKTKSMDKSIRKAESVVSKAYAKKKYDQSIAAANKFLEMKDDSHKVHYYVAKSFEKKKDYSSALKHINQAVELAGEELEDKYYWAQGNIAEKAGDKSAAVAAYKKITAEKYKENADYKIKELEGK